MSVDEIIKYLNDQICKLYSYAEDESNGCDDCQRDDCLLVAEAYRGVLNYLKTGNDKDTKINNWILIGHSSLEDGYAIVKKFTGTEEQAKSLLMKEIREERKNAINNEDKWLDFGTEKVNDLTNNSWSTNAKWYGYSSYDDCHVDFMLYDFDTVEEVIE